MKLEIWCKTGYASDLTQKATEAVLARTVIWPVVPTKNDLIIVWDGWCSERVLDVHHSLDEQRCIIEIHPDFSGEYKIAAEQVKQGISPDTDTKTSVSDERALGR